MSRENNYLLGHGERLTSVVTITKGGGSKKPPYDFITARKNVSSWLIDATTHFSQLPVAACPNELVTASITMHPRYVSKSDFPQELLQEVGLKSVGGRLKKVKPKEWGIIDHPEEALTDELLVMGTRNNISKWSNEVLQWTEKHSGASHLAHFEIVQAYRAHDKIRKIPSNIDECLLEVVLHECSSDTLESFEYYAKLYDSKLVWDRVRRAEGLTFVPVYANPKCIDEIADFSFVRVVRAMPAMRCLQPNTLRQKENFPVQLPTEMCLDASIKVAIFDGGIPDIHELPWVTSIEPKGIGIPVAECQEHGLAVTSALLFGPLESHSTIPRPLCKVDHIRVLDESTVSNGGFEYYDVLDRILDTLDNTKESYEFINLSLGPDMPIDDDEVTRWTASLDERFVGGKILATIAAGNSGAADSLSGLNRVQPPSDAVNALSIGACNADVEVDWEKTDYSSVGPGRCPGIVKPDGVIFGGSSDNPFFVLSSLGSSIAEAVEGTSFAAPYALRSAIAIRAQLGMNFNPLTIRALMVHRANQGCNSLLDVGWGRFESDYDKLITCDDDEALVVFQGELPNKDYLRAPIPLPDGMISGKVLVTATLIIAPEVDPSFPNVYTRGGLEVTFRPNSVKFKQEKDGSIAKNAQTKSFFSQKKIYGESECNLRNEGHKWETCLKATQTFKAKTLNQSCFDIYYHKRYEGISPQKSKPISYAFVVSIKTPDVPDFYARVARTYANVLIPLRPNVRIQIMK